MKNVLVTGGCGFIGSHTVVELIAAGYRPIIIDNFSNSEPGVIKGITNITKQKPMLYEGDFQDRELLRRVLDTESIEGVIHFAAFKAVGESVKQPLKYYENNVSGFVTLLKELEDTQKPISIIFSSSCTVYGEADALPLTEDSPIKPAASPYGATKQMDEEILRDSTQASSRLRAMALRYFNPIGAHPSGLIGELPRGVPSILVPFITQTVAGWREQLTVFGDDYPTPDGTCIRDYIHVVDLAKAHIKAMEYITSQAAGSYDFCNVGTGVGSSVLEVIQTFEKVTDQKVPYVIGKRRPGDIVASYAAVEKANRLLDWRSEKTLGEALVDAWRWQQTLAKSKV